VFFNLFSAAEPFAAILIAHGTRVFWGDSCSPRGRNLRPRVGRSFGEGQRDPFTPPMQGVYKFNQANFQEIPGGILRKIQDMLALLRPLSPAE